MTGGIEGAKFPVWLFQKQRYVRADVYTTADKQPKEQSYPRTHSRNWGLHKHVNPVCRQQVADRNWLLARYPTLREMHFRTVRGCTDKKMGNFESDSANDQDFTHVVTGEKELKRSEVTKQIFDVPIIEYA